MAAIGPFQWDEKERQLSREGVPVPLQPKVADTLAALLSRRGEIVEKAELMKLVWLDTTVEEVNLERNVSLLRKALGDDAGWIETAPKRGYRLRAELPQSAVRGRGTWRWAVCGLVLLLALIAWQFYVPSRFVKLAPGQAYLAVIPFEGDGGAMDETVVAELVKRNEFSVLNPSVVRRYQWVRIAPSVMARLVGVELVLEGRVGNGRVIARMSDVRSGRVIWADNYPAGVEARGQSAQSMAEALGKATR